MLLPVSVAVGPDASASCNQQRVRGPTDAIRKCP